MKPRIVRAELRKLSSTRMPWGFLGVLLVLSVMAGLAVTIGHDADGSKGFIATAEDQQELMAAAVNSVMIAGLFGAIAVSREYGHGTVVPTFLTTPRREVAVLAQFTAVMLAGALLGLVGAALTVTAVAVTLPSTGYGFLVSTGAVIQVVAASAFAGAVGAVLGAGTGALVRNLGGAVTGAVVLLMIIPPLAVQFVSGAASWVPGSLARVASGVGTDVGLVAALAALAAWAIIPATAGLVAVHRRDVI